MREIKFRAWDTELKKMFPPEDIIGLEGNTSKNVPDYLILLQYTGLKDKDGKEIYENDIIEIKHPDFVE